MDSVPALISRKRDGGVLSCLEIERLICGLTDGSVPDYQWSALAMAIYFQGMNAEETWCLTSAMRDSGSVLNWGPAGSRPVVVDKHSTGGIGDKTSLILAPLLACDGLWVPMISGRGLGITGGTLDKLESIPGYRTGLSAAEMKEMLASTGCFIAGQTEDLVPADRKLYSLRDVTGTVPSIPLITASIMSKKLAEGLDRLVLDVKWGRGAFMQTLDDASALADSMEAAGKHGGVPVTTVLSPMHQPLGRAAGNAVEVKEVLATLAGCGPEDLEKLTLDLATAVSDSHREVHQRRLKDGTALRKFQQMVQRQAGDISGLPVAPVQQRLTADRSGRITAVDALLIGQAVLKLGGGRAMAGDPVDFCAGIDEIKKEGEAVSTGETLCVLHSSSSSGMAAATALAHGAFAITGHP